MADVTALQTPAASLTVGGASCRWKWTGDDLRRMAELGVLPQDQKFELIDGEIIQLMAPSPLHAAIVVVIGELLAKVFAGAGFHVRQEKPLRLDPHYEPLPDLAVAKGRPMDYRDRFPGPADVVLVIEVAQTSVEHDRSEKLGIYAAAGIGEYWIANLREMQVEVYREPRGTEYLWRRIYPLGESLSPLSAPAASFQVSALLGQT